MKKALIYFGLTIILTLTGITFSGYFMDLSISKLRLDKEAILWETMGGQFKQSLIFVLAIGLIPILHLSAKKIAKKSRSYQDLIIAGAITLSGFIFWQLRIYHLNRLFKGYENLDNAGDVQNVYYTEDLSFGIFLAMGFIIGAAIISLIFRFSRTKKN